jgi:hypothetical protein
MALGLHVAARPDLPLDELSTKKTPRQDGEDGSGKHEDCGFHRGDISIPEICSLYFIITLWLFDIAMENGPCIDGLPIKNGDFPWLC